jgi:hypothetical protein
MSALPQAIAPNPHTNLLNVYVQIANKMGFQLKKRMCLPTKKLHECKIEMAVEKGRIDCI